MGRPDTVIVLPGEPPSDPAGFLSPAIGVVLEMHGIVGAEVVDESDLPRIAGERRTLTLITRRDDWSGVIAHLEKLIRSSACVFVEGPVPPGVAELVGVKTLPEAGPARPAAGLIADPVFCERFSHLLEGVWGGGTVSLDPIVTSSYMLDEVVDDPGPRHGAAFYLRCLLRRPVWEERKSRHELAVDSPLHALALGCAPFDVSGGGPGSDDLLVDADSPSSVLLARRANVLVSAFPMLDLLARRLAAPSLELPAMKMTGKRNGEELELLLVHSIARAARESGRPLITVEPWPEGISGVLTIRHDVDRRVRRRAWKRLLRWEQSRGIKASWYFLDRTADAARMRDVLRLGHEVAYHYTDLAARGEQELQAVTAAAKRAGADIVGACCHEGNFHAMADAIWLEDRGFLYAEMLTRTAMFPFRPVRLDDNGAARASGIIASARHVSVDRRVSPPTADFSYGRRTMTARRRMRAHIVVMNHPDINFEAFARSVDECRRPGEACWTQAETIDWWRRSHIDDVRLERGMDERGETVRLVHSSPLRPVLRVWCPPGAGHEPDEALGESHVLLVAGDVPVRVPVPRSGVHV